MLNDYNEYNSVIIENALLTQKKYSWGISKEEAIQIGWEAFLIRKENSRNNFDDSKNIKALVGLRVKGAILDTIRKNTAVRETKEGIQKSRVIKVDSLNEMPPWKIESLNELIYDFDIPCDTNITFEKIISGLKNERQKDILRLRYFQGLTLQEIAKINQISPTRVAQILEEAFNKLRKILSKEDYV